jgi:hypothetical protein
MEERRQLLARLDTASDRDGNRLTQEWKHVLPYNADSTGGAELSAVEVEA